jgi:hypothetical protein
MIKEYGVLNSTRKGKGGGSEPRKGAKLEGFSLREYYILICKV